MYIVGADIGRAQDYTAISVLEAHDLPAKGRYSRPEREYLLRHLERLELGTPYHAIVERLSAISQKIGDGDTYHVLDATGVGAPVLEAARAKIDGPVYGVIITGGSSDSYDSDAECYHVPKASLISQLQMGFSAGTLTAAQGIPMLDALMSELRSFRYEITAAGNTTFAPWREAEHDDLILSLAIGLWYGVKQAGTGVWFL